MGGSSKSKQTSTTNPSTVWAPQGAELENLYGASRAQFANSDPTAGQGALNGFQQMLQQAQGQFGNSQNQFNQAAQGYGQGYAGLDQAGGNLQNAFNNIGQGYSGLSDQAAWLKQFQNPGMDPMADVYARNVAQNFNEQIMPGLRGGAALAGGMGSSRQGIAEGLAAGRSSQQLQDFGAQLYGQQMDRSLGAATALG